MTKICKICELGFEPNDPLYGPKQCRLCRKCYNFQQLSRYYSGKVPTTNTPIITPKKKTNEKDTLEVISFVERLRHKRFITDLFELNDILHYSEMVGLTTDGMGKNIATGKQIEFLWSGLVDFYEKNKNRI